MTKELIDNFLELVKIVAKLRDPNGGCPWDLEQTHQSLKQYMIEEAYEAVEAIDEDIQKLKEELGDVLLQVVLHSQIASEAKNFDLSDVIKFVSNKLVSRHPHVFGDVVAKSSEAVLKNWERIKQTELPQGKSVLDGVPKNLPALQRAQRIGDKAARVGFEWSTNEEVRDKVFEEMNEFLEHATNKNADEDKLKDEFGDILFALSQLSRRMHLNSEELLNRSTDKFIRRFKEVEKRAKPSMQELKLEDLDKIWEDIKKEENKL